MSTRVILFLVINFFGLYLGSQFTGVGVTSSWYQDLHQAPWMPPGWLFGVAWSTIMICFAFFMAFALEKNNYRKRITILYLLQWLLNFLWNPVFFKYHQVVLGLFILLFLLIIIGYLLFFRSEMSSKKRLLVAPYFIWLVIATSLNAYIFMYN